MKKKTKIVFSSTLKPVDDSRMFEKLALTLWQTNKYEINIIGFSSKKIPDFAGIRFLPIFSFSRLSFKRLFSSKVYSKKLLELKPDIVCCCTYELLQASYRYCQEHGAHLVYDVQENYSANLSQSPGLPLLIAGWLSRLLKKKEQQLLKHCDLVVLAEKCYQKEVHAAGVILPNAFKEIPSEALPLPCPTGYWLYCGTIAEQYGIKECIDFHQTYLAKGGQAHLLIAGFCARSTERKRLERQLRLGTKIHLIGGDSLVPHAQLLYLMDHAGLGIISHRPLPHLAQRIPTRLFEFTAKKLPFLLQKNSTWESAAKEMNHLDMKVLDFRSFTSNDVAELLQWEKEEGFSKPLTHEPAKEAFWSHYEGEWQDVIAKFRSNKT